ncbi:MAG: DUF1559 domain-containing protein [Pirellulales bacterium]
MRRTGLTLVELLVCITIIGLLVALLLPAVLSAREAARRITCASQMRQIGLAVHSYHDRQSLLPPVFFGDNRLPKRFRFDRFSFSWRVAILPHLEQQNLFDQFDLKQTAYSVRNQAVVCAVLPVFLCPSRPRPDRTSGNPYIFHRLAVPNGPAEKVDETLKAAATDYQPTREVIWPVPAKGTRQESKPGVWGEVVYVEGSHDHLRIVRWSDVIDGLSNTSLIAESVGLPEYYHRENPPQVELDPGYDAAYGAWALGSLQFTSTRINVRSDFIFFSLHASGPLCAVADGSVRSIASDTSEAAVAALVTREEGDVPLLGSAP